MTGSRPAGPVVAERAAGIALAFVRRVLVAGSLALAVMAVLWAVDLSAGQTVVRPEVQGPMEGTLAGTPAPTASITSMSSAAQVTHTVVRGDTLIDLAARYLGDESRWREIYRANSGLIPDPDNLRVGTVLIIPGG